MRTALLLLACTVLVACGGETAVPYAPVRWMQAKPNPIVGELRMAVVERPAPDRVRLEAHWGRSALAGACAVDLGLPAGVLLVEGPARIELDPVDDPGRATWLLEVPQDGRVLDAVVRYCVETPEGIRAAQCAVRLTRP